MRFQRRRVLKPVLMCIAVAVVASVVLSTLRVRPAIQRPTKPSATFGSAEFKQVLAVANSQIAHLSSDLELEVAPKADNLTIARRISLGLVGSGLSLEEIRALELVPEERQIEWWTNYLLEDRRWADYFAERFSRAFVGTDNGPFLLFRRRKFNAWLSEQFAGGVGYDRIIRSMLASEGLWTDTPQVNFVTATFGEDGQRRADAVVLAGRTSRALLAQRIDCLQCHDDFVDQLNFGTEENPIDGIQENFHALAAFYGGTVLPEAPFQGIREDGEPYKVQFLGDSEESVVDPDVPFAKELLPEEGKPRQRLAKWITHPDNPAFARATVNRVWALLFSRPLVAPVDSIPLDGSVPEVLDTLARDFAQHGFDMRRLVRTIVATDAFQRDSRCDFEVTEVHESSWAVFPISQLRPEQVAGSMIQSSKLTAIDSTSSIVTRLSQYGQTQDFLKQFGDRGVDEFDGEAVTIPQRLIMMNGNLTADRTKVDLVNNAATRIASLVADNQKVVELVFLSVLGRYPSETESIAFVNHVSEFKGNRRTQAVGDLCWAMMNSTEFSWNH